MTVPIITWSSSAIAGLPSQPSIISHIATHTSILTLEQVKLNNTGTYTCTAINEGGTNTAAADITIVGKEYDKLKVMRNDVMFGSDVWYVYMICSSNILSAII